MAARRSCAALAGAVLLGGCGGEAAPRLSVQVQQYRADIARERLAVALANAGEEPLVVTGLQLRAAGFDVVEAAPQDVRLEPGDRVDLRVPYGAARCEDLGTAARDEAVVGVRTPSGEQRQVVVPVPPGNGLLERLRRRACAERALRAAVDLRLSSTWERAGERLLGALVLERRAGDERVEVVEPGGNVLFTIRPTTPARPLGVLGAGSTTLEVPLVVTATRCDGHALAESKRSYVFSFFVSVGGGEPHLTNLTADAGLQGQLDRLALDTCRPQG